MAQHNYVTHYVFLEENSFLLEAMSEANTIFFFEAMLMEINICCIRSKHYFRWKQILFSLEANYFRSKQCLMEANMFLIKANQLLHRNSNSTLIYAFFIFEASSLPP
jgi:hypothetical protein